MSRPETSASSNPVCFSNSSVLRCDAIDNQRCDQVEMVNFCCEQLNVQPQLHITADEERMLENENRSCACCMLKPGEYGFNSPFELSSQMHKGLCRHNKQVIIISSLFKPK
jgi:hypothetical protein